MRRAWPRADGRIDGDTPAVASSTQNRLACDIKILGPPFVNRDHDNIVAACRAEGGPYEHLSAPICRILL